MSHEVTMPQLGMAQDTGLIVSWIKQPGDPVKSGDVLMEVETDKSTMELEAAHDGFLTEVRAAAGENVPVGNVIAIISESADNIITPRPAPVTAEQPKTAGPVADPPVTVPQVRALAPVGADPSAAQQLVAPSGRVLASPKAKFAAFQQGIDLQQLVRNGARQPIHFGDLEKAAGTTVLASAQSTLTAHIDRNPMVEFTEWASGIAGKTIRSASVWLSFATKTLRTVTNSAPADGLICEYVLHGADDAAIYAVDADQVVLSSVHPLRQVGRVSDLKILDLSATRLADYRPSEGNATPTIVIGAFGTDKYSISLHFQEDQLPLESAISMLDDLANHAAEPMKHLL